MPGALEGSGDEFRFRGLKGITGVEPRALWFGSFDRTRGNLPLCGVPHDWVANKFQQVATWRPAQPKYFVVISESERRKNAQISRNHRRS